MKIMGTVGWAMEGFEINSNSSEIQQLKARIYIRKSYVFPRKRMDEKACHY